MESTLYRDICFYGPENQEIRGDFFIIKRKCEEILQTVIKNNEKYRRIYEEKYFAKYTFFSSAIDFCLRELDFKIALPAGILETELAPGEERKNRALFSANGMLFVDTIDKIRDGSAKEYALAHPENGIRQLTDEEVGYDITLENVEMYDDGIITNKGYISSKFVRYNMEDLASIMLLYELCNNRELYNQYKDTYSDTRGAFLFYTGLPNVIGIDNLENGTFALSFVSDNDGRVQEFIDKLEYSDMIADLDPMIVEEAPAPMVIDESTFRL